jgi:hypothetical protein
MFSRRHCGGVLICGRPRAETVQHYISRKHPTNRVSHPRIQEDSAVSIGKNSVASFSQMSTALASSLPTRQYVPRLACGSQPINRQFLRISLEIWSCRSRHRMRPKRDSIVVETRAAAAAPLPAAIPATHWLVSIGIFVLCGCASILCLMCALLAWVRHHTFLSKLVPKDVPFNLLH